MSEFDEPHAAAAALAAVPIFAALTPSVWFWLYQSTVYLALYHGSGELFTHRDARRLALLWGPLVLISIAARCPCGG